MKTQSARSRFAFGVLFSVTSACILASCSTTKDLPVEQTGTVEIAGTQSNLVGGWVNEGELRSLSLNKDGSCKLEHTDHENPAERRREYVHGTWIQKGNILTINLNNQWRGKKTHEIVFRKTGTYTTTADGKKYPEQELFQKHNGEEWILFRRVWPLAPKYQ